eukprot:TRINITY_DN923_c0_g1_i7.p1 TRINITY_DN923_c0_g1~~TRINITY_DN923_c0_g1_i7.p1  ORF type:complete len:243 (+),score=30.15 TRINITY_DN923_c0_g1_i7:673-1401(+)
MSCVISIKDQVLEKLHAHDSQLYTQTLMYRTSDRLASVVAGPSQKSRRGSTINDTRTEDLATTLIEEEALSMELVDLFCSPTASDKDRDKVNHALALALSSAKVPKPSSLWSLDVCLRTSTFSNLRATARRSSCSRDGRITFCDEVPEDLKAHSETTRDTFELVLQDLLARLSFSSPDLQFRSPAEASGVDHPSNSRSRCSKIADFGSVLLSPQKAGAFWCRFYNLGPLQQSMISWKFSPTS